LTVIMFLHLSSGPLHECMDDMP